MIFTGSNSLPFAFPFAGLLINILPQSRISCPRIRTIRYHEVCMCIIKLSLRIVLLVSILGVAGGCAHRAMDRAVASWQNQPVSAVTAAWGQPSEELKVSGKHLLLWNNYDGKLALPDQKRAPRQGAPDCVRLLEVDRNGRIATGTWDGNDCPGWFSGWSR